MSTFNTPIPVEGDRIVLDESTVELIAPLLLEAAKNISDLLETEKAEELRVRYPMTDELDGFAIMLRHSIQAPDPSTPKFHLRATDVRDAAEIMEEAAKDLRGLLTTPEAAALGVRPSLPDELESAAITLLRGAIVINEPKIVAAARRVRP